jgi:hypothetical protein
MSVVQKAYFTVQSRIKPKYIDPPTPSPDLTADISPGLVSENPPAPEYVNIYTTQNAVATASLPDWFTNAQPQYKKIIKVLGSTINFIDSRVFMNIQIVPPNPGYRMFSNIASHSNVVMRTTTATHSPTDYDDVTFHYSVSNDGFVMMINNYNSVKEYDVTYDNLRKVMFYLRPWNALTTEEIHWTLTSCVN